MSETAGAAELGNNKMTTPNTNIRTLSEVELRTQCHLVKADMPISHVETRRRLIDLAWKEFQHQNALIIATLPASDGEIHYNLHRDLYLLYTDTMLMLSSIEQKQSSDTNKPLDADGTPTTEAMVVESGQSKQKTKKQPKRKLTPPIDPIEAECNSIPTKWHMFDGDVGFWPTFHNAFNENVVWAAISDTAKLRLLERTLDAEARDEYFTLADIYKGNFQSIYQGLVNKYNKFHDVVQRWIQSMQNIPESSTDTPESIGVLSATIARALTQFRLILTPDELNTWETVYMHLGLAKLDEQNAAEWRVELRTRDHDIHDFLEFLEERQNALRNAVVEWPEPKRDVQAPQPNQAETVSVTIQQAETATPAPQANQIQKQTAVVDSTKQSRGDSIAPLCRLCKPQRHPLIRCFIFVGWVIEQRVDYIARIGWCEGCLRPPHAKGEVCQQLECLYCPGKFHNSLLCPRIEYNKLYGKEPLRPHPTRKVKSAISQTKPHTTQKYNRRRRSSDESA